MCCIPHEQTRSCWVSPTGGSQGRTWWQSLQPGLFSLKSFVQRCLTSPCLLCSLLLAAAESGLLQGEWLFQGTGIWDLPACKFERLILKVCSSKFPLSVADAGGSFLASRSREEKECSPVCGMEQWEGRRKADSRRSPGSEGSGSGLCQPQSEWQHAKKTLFFGKWKGKND